MCATETKELHVRFSNLSPTLSANLVHTCSWGIGLSPSGPAVAKGALPFSNPHEKICWARDGFGQVLQVPMNRSRFVENQAPANSILTFFFYPFISIPEDWVGYDWPEQHFFRQKFSVDPVPWVFLSLFAMILKIYHCSSRGLGGVFWDGRAQMAASSVQISQGLLGVVAAHLLPFGEDDVTLCPSLSSASWRMPEKHPPWHSSFCRTNISKPSMELASPGLPRGVPKSPAPAVAPLPLPLMLRAELPCVPCGIITNLPSRMFWGADFTCPSSLWCIVQVSLLSDCIATSAVPDQHCFCLLRASDPLGGWTRSSDASFDIPCLSYGNESSWNGLILCLAMFPSCLSGRFLFPIAPGALQRLLWSLKSLPVSLSRGSQKTVPDGSLWLLWILTPGVCSPMLAFCVTQAGVLWASAVFFFFLSFPLSFVCVTLDLLFKPHSVLFGCSFWIRKNCFKRLVTLGFLGKYIAFCLWKVWFEL